jgi:hypothetical protein
MAQKLTEKEIRIAISKIKAKYDQLVREYKKSPVLAENFNDRYRNALKNNMDISTFILAEIEAVEEIMNKEKARVNLENRKKKITEKVKEEPGVADRIWEENRKKLLKYPRIQLTTGSDEELERLIGMIRDLVNNYWPAITLIYKEYHYSTDKEKFNGYYHKMVSFYDYTGPVPGARNYIEALNRRPLDNKKVDYEHQILMKDTAFLINDILGTLEQIIEDDKVPTPDQKLHVSKAQLLRDDNWFVEYFNDLTCKESMVKIYEYVQNAVSDFRFKYIKKNSSFQ